MDQEKKTDNEAKDEKPSSASFRTNALNTNRLNGGAHLVSEIKRHAPNLPHSNENREMPLSSKGEDILDEEEEESALSQIAKGVKNAKTNLEGNVDVLAKIKTYWDKIPSFIKPMIPTILGYVAVAIAFVILIVILVAAPAGLVQNVVSGVSSFGEKLGNFFTFQGFQTDNELVAKRETEYYETLLAVQQEFREKYQVEIDIDLITATLFYNRMMGDYNVDNANDDKTETEGDAQAAADFYKIAKGHIKTLARYMVIENTFESSCGDTPNQTVDPEEERDLAKVWGFFGGIHNQRKISNVYSYNESFLYCEYKGDRDGYRDLFEQIRTRRSELEDAGNEAELNAFLEQYYNKIEVNKEEPTPGEKNPSGGSGAGDNGSSSGKAPSGNQRPNTNKHQAQRQSNVIAIVEKNPNGGASDKNNANIDTSKTYRWEMKSCSELGAVIDEDGRCYQKDPTQIIYTASYQRESVYYYRLMEPMQLGWGLIDGKSFIEAYYPDYIGEDSKDEDVKRIVDEIYSLYDMIRSSKGRFTGNIGYGGSIGVATGEWYTWKQYDSAWRHVSLGGDPNVTLGQYGCLITSIAMQMVASGTPISLPNFNPGTFVAAMPQAFDRNGNWRGGNTWSSFAPNFRMTDQVELAGDTNIKADTIAKWISEGYYLVVRVKYVTGQHWVAITGVENGRVIMADPGDNTSTDMYSRYPETQGHALTIKRFRG